MGFTLGENIRDVLIDCLRTAFISNPDYPYIDIDGGINNPDLENTQIDFFRAYPNLQTSYPIGIIESPPIPNLVRTMNGDFMSQSWGILDGVTGICNEIYGGMGELSFIINISANTSAERERVADYVVDAIRFSHRSYLEDQAIEVVDVRRRTESIKPYGSGYIYVTPVECTLFAEWGETVWTDTTILEEVQLCHVDIYGIEGLSNI